MARALGDVARRVEITLSARRLSVAAAVVSALLASSLLFAGPALAVEPINITTADERIDITRRGAFYQGRGDQLQIETAAGLDGITGRMAVSAATPGTEPNWVVFALRNLTNEHIERWLTADRYRITGSSVFWPDLDLPRITAVTPSVGFKPERVKRAQTDIFRITLDPGATVTFVAELTPARFPRLNLWKVDAFEKNHRDVTLFNGILLGITGILAIFLTAVFAANHKAVFPASALVAWSILVYLCVDFGFWHKLFQLSAEDNATYRAAAEASVAASLVIFLFFFLRIGLWHAWVKVGFAGWAMMQLALVGLALVDERMASGLARASFVPIAVVGTLLIFYLAVRGQSRALSILPTWLLLLVWIFGAGVTVLGMLSGQIVVSSLTAGLVLILALIGYTVTQFAFHSTEPMSGAPPSRLMMGNLAIEGAGAWIWEWQHRRDEIVVSHEVEEALGLNYGTLSGPREDWLKLLHPSDRERFRLIFQNVETSGSGEIDMEFRMRHSDGAYQWFELMAATVDRSQRRGQSSIGLIRDITNEKRAQERLLHDAVNDSLTGLPNRELFLDRLARAMTRTREEGARHPSVIFFDIDQFKKVNTNFGMGVGDTMLLTVARRISRHLRPQDTLARVGGDQYAILLVTLSDLNEIEMFAERVRRSIRTPMKISGREVVLTSSAGIAVYDPSYRDHDELFRDAELAMYRARQSGPDQLKIYEKKMREGRNDRAVLADDLKRALDAGQLTLAYQPIVRLARGNLVGFEALLRWDHPQYGRIPPEKFVRIAEDYKLILQLGGYVLERAVNEAARWQKLIPYADEPMFVSVNVSSSQLFHEALIRDVQRISVREDLPRGALRLEITETVVMKNAERAAEILETLRSYGARLSLDDFGTGYSSLAYLHRFPFDTIKVDKELVHASGTGDEGLAILRSIVALAHELGKDVVAEGVEDYEELNYLRSIHCDYAQGFTFHKPMTPVEVQNLLVSLAKRGHTIVEVPQPPTAETGQVIGDGPTAHASPAANGQATPRPPAMPQTPLPHVAPAHQPATAAPAQPLPNGQPQARHPARKSLAGQSPGTPPQTRLAAGQVVSATAPRPGATAPATALGLPSPQNGTPTPGPVPQVQANGGPPVMPAASESRVQHHVHPPQSPPGDARKQASPVADGRTPAAPPSKSGGG